MFLQLNNFIYCYLALIQINIIHSFAHSIVVKSIVIYITCNPIKHQSFVYTHLNDQTVLFQTIQFSISTQFKCQKVQVYPLIGPSQVLTLRVRVNLGVMAMKGYSAFPKATTLLEPHQQIVSCLQETCWVGDLILCSDPVGVFYSPSRLGSFTRYYHFELLSWLIGFYGTSTFVGYLTPNPFLCK